MSLHLCTLDTVRVEIPPIRVVLQDMSNKNLTRLDDPFPTTTDKDDDRHTRPTGRYRVFELEFLTAQSKRNVTIQMPAVRDLEDK